MTEADNFQNISFGIPTEKTQRKKLFLFRFPKDFDLSSLDSTSIHLPKKGENVDLKIGASEYKIRLDDEQYHSSIRPIISNENHVHVGDPFAASFSVTRSLSLKSDDQSPAITSYCKVPQVEGLAVRHMPFGSTTTLQDLQSRLGHTKQRRDNEDAGQSKRRKSDVATTNAIEETPSKPKKSKKNKKSNE